MQDLPASFYGPTPSLTLAPGLPTDRLLVEWPLRHRKVEMRRRGRFDRYETDKIPKALERKMAATASFPGPPRLDMTGQTLLVEVPKSMSTWRKGRRQFQPGVGSFGISFWILNPAGEIERFEDETAFSTFVTHSLPAFSSTNFESRRCAIFLKASSSSGAR
jgi:hypothetical protein